MANGLMKSGDANEALLAEFKTLPQDLQTGLLQYVTNNPDMSPAQVAGLMRDTLAEYGQANGLVAAPNGMELHNEVGELRQQYENGLTTINSSDIERLTFAVQNTVKQMIAQGASDDAIQQAVGNLPGVTPELSQLAQQVAQQQLDAEKFTLLADARNNEPAASTEPTFTLAAIFDKPMMEFAAPQQAPEQQAALANPFALALSGNENIFASLASMNGDPFEANRGNLSQLRSQFASQTEQRGLGDPFSIA